MAANDLPPGMPSLSDMQQLMASLAQMQYMMLRQSQAQVASRSLDEQQPPLETAPKAEEGAPESQLAQADEDNDNGEAAEADAAEGHVEDNMEEVKVDPAPEKASHPVKKAEYENETTDQRVKTIYKRVGWYTIDKNAKLEILARIHERPKKKENDDGHGVGSVRETLKPTPKVLPVKTTVPEPEGPPPRLRLELAQKNMLEYYHHNLSFFATCRPRRSKREKESDRSGRRSRGSGSGGQGSREKRHRGQYD